MHHFRRIVLVATGLCILSCTLIVHSQIAPSQPDHWQSLVDAGTKAQRQKQFLVAKKFFEQALKEAERSGYNDSRVSKSFKLLGDLFFAQQKYDEAKVYYSRTEALDSEATNLQSAETFFAAGDFARAKDLAQMALKDMERRVGRQDVVLTPSLIALGKADKALNNETEAEEVLNRAVRILNGAGEEHKELASALDLLGQVLDDQNKSAEAEPLFKRSLAIRQKILASDDPDLAASLGDLAEHYRRLGRAVDAEPLLKQASEIQDKGLMDLKDYVDKENGFRLGVPIGWIKYSGMAPFPGLLIAFQSPDSHWAVLVMRSPIPSGGDPALIFDSAGEILGSAVKGEDLGEENVELSGLPARRIVFSFTRGNVKGQDWVTLLVTRSQVWILQFMGPPTAMGCPSALDFQASQNIASSFAFLDPVLQVLKAQTLTPPPPRRAVVFDAANHRHYVNQELGMEILLPDEWRESNENSASFQEGKTVVLNQTGTLAFVIMAREHLEASPDLYLKTLTGNVVGHTENFRQLSQEIVTRQGLEGTHIVWVTREDGVDYRSVLEVFSAGTEHYRIVARAPTEVFDRYATTFNQMLESIQFLSVVNQPSP
jgi:tetratricopeptide (TPR) repeat protein